MSMTRGLKKPVQFVPEQYRDAVMSLSKAALADIAWNLAGATCNSAEDVKEVWAKFAEEAHTTAGNYRGDKIDERFTNEWAAQ